MLRIANALLLLLLGATIANSESASPGPTRVHSFKDSAPLSSLPHEQQKNVLRALSDDIAELSQLDIASTTRSKSAYRQYVTDRLQFQPVTEQLLLVSYKSNTVCGQHENCPVWIIRLDASTARSMVPWQNELGTSAGGAWGFASHADVNAPYPELVLLTHLSSAQTGLACYRETKQHYLRVTCSPGSTRWLQYADQW
jgi:hypothetical protein